MNEQQARYMARLMRRCSKRIDEHAETLKECSTVGDVWPDYEHNARRLYNAEIKDAQRLRHAADVLQRSFSESR